MKKLRVFSGIQPSGILHIGNYLGALKQFVELQHTYEAFFCVVDEHAITIPQDPAQLRANTLAIAITYLAAGIDPKKATIFVQSHVPAHTELGWILNTMTPLGELERMTQWKDKAGFPEGTLMGKNRIMLTDKNKLTGKNVSKIIKKFEYRKKEASAGLLNYPVLMAADILLYHTAKVPVGEDQLQHLELARSLAKRFNNRFGDTFVVPNALVRKDMGRIMGLDDPSKKMSKSAASAANYIALLDDPETIRKKIKAAVTDSGNQIHYDEKEKPAVSNLMRIYSAFGEKSIDELERHFAGKGYLDFKHDLAETIIEKLAPFQRAYQEYAADEGRVRAILQKGAERANEVANETLRSVKEKIGFLVEH